MSQEESALVNKESKEFIKILQNQTNEVKIDNKNEEVSMNYIDFIPQVFASCLAYLIVVQAGISMSFSSILITQLADGKEIELTKDSASIIASIWSLALPIGAISSGYLMDKFGRRKTALFICFPFTFSWILTSLAQNVMMIYIARVVLGICTGLTTAAVVYVAEISFKKVRSGLLCMNSVWVSFGIFSTYLLNFFGLNWRTIGYVYATMSFLCIFAIYFIPESPHWLLILNKKSEEDHKILQTQKSFQWFYKRKQVSEFHYNELLKVKNSTMNTTDDITRTTLADIKKRQVYKPLIIFIFLFLLQQCAGGYVLIFYTLNIFRNLGADVLNTIDEKLALVLVGSIRLVMAIVAAILAQRCQRKVLLYISTIGMGIFAIIAGSQMTSVESSSLFIKRENASVSITQHVSGDEMSNYILIFSIFLYMLFASVGILIIPWILTSELFSIRHKAKFGGFCVAFAYIIMSIILKFFPFALEYFSLPIIFTFFGIVSIITAIFVFIFIPETHQKTFAEIEQNFLNSK